MYKTYSVFQQRERTEQMQGRGEAPQDGRIDGQPKSSTVSSCILIGTGVNMVRI
jgi:hypothetical protein